MADIHVAALMQSSVKGLTAASFSSNRSFSRHSHEEYGVGVIAEGAQRSWSGLGFVESLPGDVITVNPGEIHDGVPIAGCVRRWHMLYVSPAVLMSLKDDACQMDFEFTRPSTSDPVGRQLFFSAYRQAIASQCCIAIETSLAHLTQMLSQTTALRSSTRNGAPAIHEAIAMIDTTPGAPHSLDALAAASGVSKFQLLRGFTKHLGITPHAYLIHRRVQLARRSIIRGVSFVDTALSCGFADQSHMTRAFVRQYGVTPGQLRSAHR